MNKREWGKSQQDSEPKFIIMSLKVFERKNYKTSEAYESDINAVMREVQLNRKPINVTSLPGEVHVLYGSEVQQ